MNTKDYFKKITLVLENVNEAVARVFLVPGEGNLIINKVPGEKYLQYNSNLLNQIWAPLKN